MGVHARSVLKGLEKASILWAVAHRWEAAPFLEEFGLKPVAPNPLPFPLFSDDEHSTWLLLTGSGKVRAASAVAGFLGAAAPLSENTVLANFGWAGGPQSLPLQSGVLVNKVKGEEGECILPDRLLSCDWSEASVLTVAQPTTEPRSTLVDMELAGVFSAGELFLSTSQLVAGKFVSDHLTGGELPSYKELKELHLESYGQRALEFAEFVRAHQTHLKEESRRIQAEKARSWALEQSFNFSVQQKLTVTQTRTLERKLTGVALAAKPEELKSFEILLESADIGDEKAARNRGFSNLMKELVSPEFEGSSQ